MSRFKFLGSSAALLFFASLFPAMAFASGVHGIGVLRCDGCSSVSAISNTAASWLYEHEGDSGYLRFFDPQSPGQIIGEGYRASEL